MIEPLFTHPWFLWTVVLPLTAALLAFLFPRQAVPLALATGVAMPLLVGATSAQLLQFGPILHQLGGWQTPLGIMLLADGPAVIMLLASALVGLVTTIYACAYFSDSADGEPPVARSFWPLWLFLWAACNALFVSSDLFNLYITLELITISAISLTALTNRPTALTAAMRYLLTGLAGSLAYLFGVALLYSAYGTVDLSLLAVAMTSDTLSRSALALMSAGLLLKAALFPFHFWLPPAHANAPAPVSAILSGLVVKAPLLILLRLWFDVFAEGVTMPPASLLGGVGAVAIIWGSLLALRQPRLKLLVAYSTVAQIGYLFLLFPLARGEASTTAWVGGLLLVLSHACAKTAMFLVAGTVQRMTGHDRLSDLVGAGTPLGAQLLIFALAAMSIIGLPPSGGFTAKWMLLNAAIVTGQWWYVLVIGAGTLMAGAYCLRVLSRAFVQTPLSAYRPLSPAMTWSPLALGLLALALGVAAYQPALLSLIGAPVTGVLLPEILP